jgi:ferritin-like metal-binding protein YciE
MIERLTGLFGRAATASLKNVGQEELGDQLDKYLADAHAIEQQATKLLEKGPKLAGAEEVADAYEHHLEETRGHSQLIEDRLQARGSKPSTLKDAAMRLGALNWGMLFAAQVDTPAKLAAFAYAFEHLEVAAYKLLQLVATRADDRETVATADTILLEERAAAATIHGLFDQALDASLREAGVAA